MVEAYPWLNREINVKNRLAGRRFVLMCLVETTSPNKPY
jgi:hypothetical protein